MLVGSNEIAMTNTRKGKPEDFLLAVVKRQWFEKSNTFQNVESSPSIICMPLLRSVRQPVYGFPSSCISMVLYQSSYEVLHFGAFFFHAASSTVVLILQNAPFTKRTIFSKSVWCIRNKTFVIPIYVIISLQFPTDLYTVGSKCYRESR